MPGKLGPPIGGSGRAGYEFPKMGFSFALCVALIGLAALNASVNVLFLVFGSAVGLLLSGALMARGTLRKLRVTRETPDAAVAGRPFVVRYCVSNHRARRAAYSIRICETLNVGPHVLRVEAYVDHVPANGTAVIDVPISAPGRGYLRFETIRLTTRFPFGLFGRRLTVAAHDQTTIFPALLNLRKRFRDARQTAARQALRAREDRHSGEEFYGLRDYREGDSMHRVHWRRSACTGQLVVREMAEQRTQTVIVALDTHIANPTLTALRERAICAAATLLVHALEEGFRVGLVVLARVPIVVPPTSGRGLRARLMEQLSSIGDPPGQSSDAMLESLRWPPHWRGRCVLIAASADQRLRRTASALRPRVNALDVLAADGPDFDTWFSDSGGRPQHASGAAEGTVAAA